jgi:hypothetical protein
MPKRTPAMARGVIRSVRRIAAISHSKMATKL